MRVQKKSITGGKPFYKFTLKQLEKLSPSTALATARSHCPRKTSATEHLTALTIAKRRRKADDDQRNDVEDRLQQQQRTLTLNIAAPVCGINRRRSDCSRLSLISIYAMNEALCLMSGPRKHASPCLM